MARNTYEAPAITEIGSLHDMTLQIKFFGSSDGIQVSIPGQGPTDIGNVSV